MAVLTDMIATGKDIVKERISHFKQQRRAVLDEFLDPLKEKPVAFALARLVAEFVAIYEAVCFLDPPTYKSTAYGDLRAMTESVIPLDRYRWEACRASEKRDSFVH